MGLRANALGRCGSRRWRSGHLRLRRRLPGGLLTVWMALALAAGAQPPPDTQAPSSTTDTPVTPSEGSDPDKTWTRTFRDLAEVRVVEIEVFVDHEGDPVEGLDRDDFELRLDGEPVPIQHFFPVVGGRALDEGPRQGDSSEIAPADRLLLIYVDNANLSPTGRSRAFAHLRNALLDRWDPGIRVVLAATGAEAKTLQFPAGATEVPHEIFVALEALEHQTAGGRRFALEERELIRAIEALDVDVASGLLAVKGDPAESQDQLAASAQAEAEVLLPQIHDHAQQRLDHVRSRLAVLRGFVDLAAGIGERTSLLYLADHLTLRPAETLFERFDRQLARVPQIAGFQVSQLDASLYDATDDFLEIVRHANGSRVTFYGLDTGSSASTMRGDVAFADGGASPALASLADVRRRAGHQLLAEGTGGRANLGSADLDRLLASVFSDLDHYYSLGFDGAKLEGRSRIEVGLRDSQSNPGWKVRHRRTVRTLDDRKRLEQRTLAALHTDPAPNPLEAELETGEPEDLGDGTLALPVTVRMPMANLALAPREGEYHQARVSLFVATLDARGRTSDVARKVCPIRVPNAELPTALGRGAGCGIRLALLPGSTRLAVVIHDGLAARTSTLGLDLDLTPTRANTASAEDRAARPSAEEAPATTAETSPDTRPVDEGPSRDPTRDLRGQAPADPLAAAYWRALEPLARAEPEEAVAAVARFEQRVFGAGQRSASLMAAEVAVARQLATRNPELLIPLLVLHESRYRQSHRVANYQLATHSRALVAQLSDLLLEHEDDPRSRRRVADILTSEAAYLLEIGSTLAARKTLDAALDHDPEHPIALFLGATIDEAWGDIDGARRLLETYLELDPASFEARLRLGVSHIRLGNLATAEALLRAVSVRRARFAPILRRICGWEPAKRIRSLGLPRSPTRSSGACCSTPVASPRRWRSSAKPSRTFPTPPGRGSSSSPPSTTWGIATRPRTWSKGSTHHPRSTVPRRACSTAAGPSRGPTGCGGR